MKIKDVVNNVRGMLKDKSKIDNKNYSMSQDEKDLSALIQKDFNVADSEKDSLETQWEDEYFIYKGCGLQWKTSKAYRADKVMQKRPNSEDNFIFSAIQNIKANLTQTIPEATIESPAAEGYQEGKESISNKITFMSKFNDERNNFKSKWKKMVQEFVSYGPLIIGVLWDENWIGGTGPNKWVGDVRLTHVNKEEFYPDPSITDLEENINDCSYIIRRLEEKITYIKKTWPETARVVTQDIEDSLTMDSQQSYLYEYWHRDFPFYMPDNRKKELLQEAETYRQKGEQWEWKAKEYEDMAKGDIEGVHLAYMVNNTVLEYIPYVYDHGKYPFVFKTRYNDINCQWGWGEIRNIMIPQILHNKADEIEIDAMSRTGVGGDYVRKGAMSSNQKRNVIENSSQNGGIFEVDDPNGIVPKSPAIVPGNITNYKNQKQTHISDISVSQIQMGQQPSANTPYRTIAELGNRADAKTKNVGEILEDALIDMNKLRISLFQQFYTEERYYRIKGSDKQIKEGTVIADEMFLTWNRITIDEQTGQEIQSQESFEVEFDVNVKIIDEKPSDRNYYMQIAQQSFQMGILTPKFYWQILDDGKLPPVDDILKDLEQMQQGQAQAQQQQQQAEMGLKQEELQMKQADMLLKNKQQQESAKLEQQKAQQEQQGEEGEAGQEQQKSPDEFIQMLQQHFPEIWDMISKLPEQKQAEVIDQLLELEPEELETALITLKREGVAILDELMNEQQ